MSEQPLRIMVHGAAGRMGRAVLQACAGDPMAQIVAATESAGSTLLGADAGEMASIGKLGVPLTDDLAGGLRQAQIVIDFTRPDGTMTLIDAMPADGPRPVLVTGTTGVPDLDQRRIVELAGTTPVVQAANFSVGVNLCVKLTELAAKILDGQADVEIIEAHHRNKVDAPSGTALRLGEAVAQATGRKLRDHAVMTRTGHTGPRPPNAIGFATVRAGDIVGDHTVLFASEGERLEITHRASSRQNFANGALRAAYWAVRQPPGLYDMVHVLGLA